MFSFSNEILLLRLICWERDKLLIKVYFFPDYKHLQGCEINTTSKLLLCFFKFMGNQPAGWSNNGIYLHSYRGRNWFNLPLAIPDIKMTRILNFLAIKLSFKENYIHNFVILNWMMYSLVTENPVTCSQPHPVRQSDELYPRTHGSVGYHW